MFNKYEFLNAIVKILNGVSVSGATNVMYLGESFKMLTTLKKGLEDEDKAKNHTIETLKETIKRLETPHAEEGQEIIGGQHYEIDFKKDGGNNGE